MPFLSVAAPSERALTFAATVGSLDCRIDARIAVIKACNSRCKTAVCSDYSDKLSLILSINHGVGVEGRT